MSYNTLYMSSENSLNLFQDGFKKNSTSYLHFDYIKRLKQNGIKEFSIYLQTTIEISQTNLLVIQLDNFDASIKVELLKDLKEKYNLKIVFIFLNSQNSFEFIDRYYAQLANCIILDDTPYSDDFYTMLEIPFLKIDYRKFIYTNQQKQPLEFNISHIEKKTIFASSLNHLSYKVHTDYYYKKYHNLQYSIYSPEYYKLYQNLLIENKISQCFLLLDQNKIKEQTVFLDNKFKKAQKFYNLFWISYSYFYLNNMSFFEALYACKSFWDLKILYKILNYFKAKKQNNITIPYKVLNTLFYKSCEL